MPGQPPAANPQPAFSAGPGRHILVSFLLDEGEEQLEFDIVPDDMADIQLGYLGAGTPLALAITGHLAGDEIPYRQADIRAVRILQVGPARTPPPQEVKARREETIRRAVDASDRTNAVIFASSFSGKWGDYDPSAFLDDEEKDEKEQD